MPDYDRYLTCTLGALLMDQIITHDAKAIEKATHSIERGWVQMTGLESRDTLDKQEAQAARYTDEDEALIKAFAFAWGWGRYSEQTQLHKYDFETQDKYLATARVLVENTIGDMMMGAYIRYLFDKAIKRESILTLKHLIDPARIYEFRAAWTQERQAFERLGAEKSRQPHASITPLPVSAEADTQI